MAQELINIGTSPNDGSGDPLRVAFAKINNNFTQLFATGFATYQTTTPDNTANQVILEFPAVLMTQATFQINSSNPNTNDSQNITINAAISNDADTVQWTGHSTIFINNPVTRYDMTLDINSGKYQDILNKFIYPDQQYLTIKYSGKWTHINPKFYGNNGEPHWKALFGTNTILPEVKVNNNNIGDMSILLDIYKQILNIYPELLNNVILKKYNQIIEEHKTLQKTQKEKIGRQTVNYLSDSYQEYYAMYNIKQTYQNHIIHKYQSGYYHLDRFNTYNSMNPSVMFPEIQELDEAGKFRGEVEMLPDEALQHRGMIGHAVENFGRGETPPGELAAKGQPIDVIHRAPPTARHAALSRIAPSSKNLVIIQTPSIV